MTRRARIEAGGKFMLQQIEGSAAVAQAVAACRPQVIAAYPITPQTHIVEGLGDMVKRGLVGNCQFLNVESEFGAMSVCIGSSATGARTYTATSSQGMLFMMEAVYNASGLGLPIVMTVGNRAIGPPINIWNDWSDSMAARDDAWIQMFVEDNQQAADVHVQAFRLAEAASLPVMVCMDGFILTHAYTRVDVPEQADVDSFLPAFNPQQALDPGAPITMGAMVGPEAFAEVRFLAHYKQLEALDLIPRHAADFGTIFDRSACCRSAATARFQSSNCAMRWRARNGSSFSRRAWRSAWAAFSPPMCAWRSPICRLPSTRSSAASVVDRLRVIICGACSIRV
jgi:pyruvate ferredoxin oxidoreductase alpha subunit